MSHITGFDEGGESMKTHKIIISFLLALMILLSVTGASSGETYSALDKQIQGSWDVTDLRGDSSEGAAGLSAALQMIQTIGGSMTMTFSDSTLTLSMTVLGMDNASEIVYRTDGDRLILEDGLSMQCTVNGNEMVLSDGGMSIVLQRSGSAETSDGISADVPQSSVFIGTWSISEVSVNDSSTEDTLMKSVKPYVDQGFSFIMSFDAEQVSIEITNSGDPMKEVAPYTFDDSQLMIGNDIVMDYIFVDGRLLLASNGDEMILDRISSTNEPSSAEEKKDDLDRTVWKMADISLFGFESFTMRFEGGRCQIAFSFDGEARATDTAYSYDGKILSMNGSEAIAEINGDALILREKESSIMFYRVTDPLDGTVWEMTGFTGGDFDTWIMEFSDGICTVTYSVSGKTEKTSFPYSFDGNILSMNGSDAAVTISGSTMTITDNGATMTLVKRQR